MSNQFDKLKIQTTKYLKESWKESSKDCAAEEGTERALRTRDLEGETFMKIVAMAKSTIAEQSGNSNPLVAVIKSSMDQLKHQMQNWEKAIEEMKWTVKYREISLVIASNNAELIA